MRWRSIWSGAAHAGASWRSSGRWWGALALWRPPRRPGTCGRGSPRPSGLPWATPATARSSSFTPPVGASRGVYLTGPQLAAAAVVLVLISATATWWAGPGVAARGGGAPGSDTPAAVRPASAPEAAAPEALAPELEELEAVLDAVRGRLDPNTVRIIEGNLGVIDRAIEESRNALAVDPGNAFLEEHLERAYRRKLSYLREATRIADWSS